MLKGTPIEDVFLYKNAKIIYLWPNRIISKNTFWLAPFRIVLYKKWCSFNNATCGPVIFTKSDLNRYWYTSEGDYQNRIWSSYKQGLKRQVIIKSLPNLFVQRKIFPKWIKSRGISATKTKNGLQNDIENSEQQGTWDRKSVV